MNILSFDIEEPWHTLPRNPAYESSCRRFDMEQFFENLLLLLDPEVVSPIFFWVGTVAERHKQLVRKLFEMNFLIASHSYDHEDYSRFSGKALGQALATSKKHLEDIVGKEVSSFRAPGFSIGEIDDFWIGLEEAGFQYDFSICDAPRLAGGGHNSGIHVPKTIPGRSIVEFPMSFSKILGKTTYVTGGGYFRICPPAILNVVQRRNSYNMYYLHPIDFIKPEFTSKDPRSAQQKFRQGIQWGNTAEKLAFLINNNEWHIGCESDWARDYE